MVLDENFGGCCVKLKWQRCFYRDEQGQYSVGNGIGDMILSTNTSSLPLPTRIPLLLHYVPVLCTAENWNLRTKYILLQLYR